MGSAKWLPYWAKKLANIGFGSGSTYWNVKSSIVDELRAPHEPVCHRRDIRIQPHMVQPEHEIIGGQRCAIGPLDARAQADSRDSAVFANAPGFGQVGQDVAQVRRDRQRMFPVEELPGVPERDARRAAVLADCPVRLDDDGIVRAGAPPPEEALGHPGTGFWEKRVMPSSLAVFGGANHSGGNEVFSGSAAITRAVPTAATHARKPSIIRLLTRPRSKGETRFPVSAKQPYVSPAIDRTRLCRRASRLLA